MTRQVSSLLFTANALWRESLKCIEGSPEQNNIERAIKCLYAGTELVLPTSYELRFRLLLVRILNKYTRNTKLSHEQLRRCMQILQNRPDCPLQLRFMTFSMWIQDELAVQDRWMGKHLEEARTLAISADELDWWIHFDYLAWRRGFRYFLTDSIELLKQRNAREKHLFLYILLSISQDVAFEEILKLIMDERGDDNPTVYCFGACIILRWCMEGGYSENAKLIIEKYTPLMNTIDGVFPGYINSDPKLLRTFWDRLVALFSVRSGEPITELITQILPNVINSFDQMSKNIGFGDQGKTAYSREFHLLIKLLDQSIKVPQTTFEESNNFKTCCPQLETFRLIIAAVSAYHSKEPTHIVKSLLLSSLKLLNSITQNTHLKTIVLLLVGELYMNTDFQMAIKMNSAAYSFASTAKWELLSFLSSNALKHSFNLLGNLEEAKKYSILADNHKNLIRCNIMKSFILLEDSTDHNIH